jgi:hypothetical protein
MGYEFATHIPFSLYLYNMKVLISEQQLRRIITEQSSTITVSSGYTTSDCDELHSFQSTKKTVKGKEVSKIIGDMNGIVGKKLEELYKNGINPMVSKVDVTVNGNRVDWTCTIGPSSDGKAWMGFTSRGAGCNNGNVLTRSESSAAGNDMATLKSTILGVYKSETSIDLEMVNDFIHLDGGKVVTEPKTKVSNIKGGGNYAFRQVFYRYTKPNSFPPVSGGKSSSVNKDEPKPKNNTPVDKPNNTPVINFKKDTPVSGDNEDYDTLKINTSDLSSFIQEVRTKTQGLTVSLGSSKTDITPDDCSFEILYVKPGRKDVSGTCKKIKRFTVALSTQNEGETAADNILSKNPGSKVIRKGTFDNGRTWKLIAVM